MDAAIDPLVYEAEHLLDGYAARFRDYYGSVSTRFVEIPCAFGGTGVRLYSNEVVAREAGEPGLLILGPSGCSKTLLGYRLALAALQRGAVPIIVAAKDYQGNFADVANVEAALLGAPDVRAVISASRRLDRQLVLVIDGYNECPADQRVRLTRSLAAVSRRYEARVIISSQSALERPDVASLADCVAAGGRIRQQQPSPPIAVAVHKMRPKQAPSCYGSRETCQRRFFADAPTRRRVL